MSYSVRAKMPNSPSLAYESRWMDDETKAGVLYQKKLRELGRKGFDVWLSKHEWPNKETVIAGPGWRDLYSKNPQNPNGVNP